MINLHEFKQAVLQKAMQGKLTKQLPNDGNASDLLDKIKQQKQYLAEAGKIRKRKPLPLINKKGIPFKIPKNWKWTKLDNVSLIRSGKRVPRGMKLSNVKAPKSEPYLRVTDMSNMSVNINSLKFADKRIIKKINKYRIYSNDIYITVAGTLGKVGIVPKILNGVLLTENANRITPINMYQIFILYLLASPLIKNQIYKLSHKVAQPKLSIRKIRNFVIPVPPLPEQKRIVSKVDKCFALADTIQKEHQLNQRFAKDMKQSLLQTAMKGKLTKQLPSDGNAEDLLKKIKQRKQQLVETGKIRKRKTLPPVNKKDVPFKIPKNWKWTRLRDISIYLQKGKSPKYSKSSKLPVLNQKCIRWIKIDYSHHRYIDSKYIKSYKEDRFLAIHDILWNSTGHGTLGRLAIVTRDLVRNHPRIVVNGDIIVLRTSKYISSYFLLLFLVSNTVQKFLPNIITGSTKQTHLNISAVSPLFIPIPPLPEQKRIVNKLDMLFSEISN